MGLILKLNLSRPVNLKGSVCFAIRICGKHRLSPVFHLRNETWAIYLRPPLSEATPGDKNRSLAPQLLPNNAIRHSLPLANDPQVFPQPIKKLKSDSPASLDYCSAGGSCGGRWMGWHRWIFGGRWICRGPVERLDILKLMAFSGRRARKCTSPASLPLTGPRQIHRHHQRQEHHACSPASPTSKDFTDLPRPKRHPETSDRVG